MEVNTIIKESRLSEKKLEANRSNAKLSTGPKTERGKRFSRLNGIRHGLSGEFCLLPGEDGNLFNLLRKSLIGDLKPGGFLELALVDRMAGLIWRMRRAVKYESGLLTLEGRASKRDTYPDWNPFSKDSGLSEEETERVLDLLSMGKVFRGNSSGENALKRLHRYETSLERSFFRNLHELQRLQKQRNGENVDAPAVLDVDISVTDADKD